MDLELTEILDEHQRVTDEATLVRDFLLKVLEDNQSDIPKFGEEALAQAALIIERWGQVRSTG
jgi:oligoribonuclease (3'-5' exoribonuclease)